MHPVSATRSLRSTSIDSFRSPATSPYGVLTIVPHKHRVHLHLLRQQLPQGMLIRIQPVYSLIRSHSSASQPTPEQLSQLRSLVAQMSGGAAAEPGDFGPLDPSARILR